MNSIQCGLRERVNCQHQCVQTILLASAIALAALGLFALGKQFPGMGAAGGEVMLVCGGVLAVPFAVDFLACLLRHVAPCMSAVCGPRSYSSEK